MGRGSTYTSERAHSEKLSQKKYKCTDQTAEKTWGVGIVDPQIFISENQVRWSDLSELRGYDTWIFEGAEPLFAWDEDKVGLGG